MGIGVYSSNDNDEKRPWYKVALFFSFQEQDWVLQQAELLGANMASQLQGAL